MNIIRFLLFQFVFFTFFKFNFLIAAEPLPFNNIVLHKNPLQVSQVKFKDFHLKDIHEIISKKEDFYKVKSVFEKKLDNFEYSGIEWRPLNYLGLKKEQNEKIVEILESLEELDDVQNIYTNANLGNINTWKL